MPELRQAPPRALVSGAASGIGRATVARLLADGAHVTGLDVDERGLEDRAREHAEYGERYVPIVGDVTAADDRAAALDAAVDADGALDMLVNNAGIFIFRGADATQAEWERMFSVNLLAHAQLTGEAVPALERSERAAVVNVSSISGHIAQAGRWTYNSCKAGLLSLTRCQALDLGPLGIRVNSVSPGWIWTEALDADAGGDRARMEPVWGAFCPLNRCGEPDEVAGSIAFLLGPDAAFVNGTDLAVDGGYLAAGPEGAAFPASAPR